MTPSRRSAHGPQHAPRYGPAQPHLATTRRTDAPEAPETPDAVVRDVVVPVPLEAAFHAFQARIARWWPSDFAVEGRAFAPTRIEPRQGGLWFARNGADAPEAWGRVTEWRPPLRLAFTWGAGPTLAHAADDRASRVIVTFAPAGAASTRVRVEHRDFARHGGAAEEVRALAASGRGWAHALAGFRLEVG